MKLHKIIIENFRCFESLEVDFDEDINVIVGVNGAGKTTLLDAIAIALNDINRRLFVDNKNDTGVHYFNKDDFHVFPLQDKNNFRNDNIKVSEKSFIELETKIESGEFKLQVNYDLVNNNFVSFRVKSDNSDNIHNTLNDFSNIAKHNSTATIPFSAYYLDYRNFVNSPAINNLFGMRSDRFDAFANCFNGGSSYESMCRWFFLRTHLEMIEREQCKNWEFKFNDLQAIRDVFNTIFEAEIRIFYGGDTSPYLMVEMTNNNKTEILKLDQLSAGYRNQISMILDFAYRLSVANPHLENPLESPGILLIDEIELHSHPKWQQTMIPNLRKIFPNTQLIVTTHSPQTLTTVDCNNVRILKNNAVYHIDETTKGAEAKRMLENILETESRPPNSEIGKKIKNIFDLINENKLDTAQHEINKLENIKKYEHAITEAETLISCKLWEKEIGL